MTSFESGDRIHTSLPTAPASSSPRPKQCRCINLCSSTIATATLGQGGIPTDLWREHIEELEAAIARIRTSDLSDLEPSLYAQIKALEKMS